MATVLIEDAVFVLHGTQTVEVGQISKTTLREDRTLRKMALLFIDKIPVQIKLCDAISRVTESEETILHGSLRKTNDRNCRRNSCVYNCNRSIPSIIALSVQHGLSEKKT